MSQISRAIPAPRSLRLLSFMPLITPNGTRNESSRLQAGILTLERGRTAEDKKLIRIREICQRFGIERHTWRKWVSAGIAPPPVATPGYPRWCRYSPLQFSDARES